MGEQGRWQERLQEFDFAIEHRLGRKHGHADALSRRPCGRPECCRTTIVIIRPEVQQIVEVLGELKGAADRSDSTDSEEDSQRGADIEDMRKYGDRASSQGHVPPDVVVQVGDVTSKVVQGATSKMAEDVSSKVAEGSTSTVADGISSTVADDATSNVAEVVSSKVAGGASSKVDEGVTSNVADGVSSKVAEGATSTVAEGVTSKVAEDVSSKVAEGVTSKVDDRVSNDRA